MTKFKLTAIILLLSGWSSFSYPAVDYPMRLYTYKNGLSNNNVNAIIQDRKGFIWVASGNGLDRFNGSDFKCILTGYDVRYLFEGHNNDIWIGLREGKVLKYDNITGLIEEFSCYNSMERANGDVTGITEDEDGTVWVAVDRCGLVRLDTESKQCKRYSHDVFDESSISHNALTDITIGKDGSLWIPTWGGGLNKFDPSSELFDHPMHNLIADDPMHGLQSCTQFINEEELWVGTTHSGVSVYNTRSGTSRTIKVGPVNDIKAGPGGNVWVATSDGLSIINPIDFTVTDVSVIVSNQPRAISAKCLCHSRDGSMWMGTDNGLLIYNSQFSRFGICVPANQIDESEPTKAVVKDHDGYVWIKDRRGLHRSYKDSDGSIREEDMTPYLTDKNVRSLFVDSKGNVWMGCFDGILTKYDRERHHFQRVDLTSSSQFYQSFRSIICYYEDSDGKIWVGSEVGLLKFDPSTGKSKFLYRSGALIYPEEKTYGVTKDLEGNLWVATMGGLLKFDPSLTLVQRYSSDNTDSLSISNNHVNCVISDSKGTIWAGTSNGLNRMDRDSKTFILVKLPGSDNGFPVFDMEEGNDGNLWITSSSGLICLGTDNDNYIVYNDNDGLLGTEFTNGSIYKAYDGEIFINSFNGANRFYPESLHTSQSSPPVYIQDIRIFNKSVIPGEGSALKTLIENTPEVILDCHQSMISLEFSALDFISPHNNLYEYKLEGVDGSWITTNADKRSASYSNLSPGKYTFKVRLLTLNGQQTGNSAKVRIIIKPPLWATTSARILYALLLAGLLTSIILFSKKRRIQEEKQDIDSSCLKQIPESFGNETICLSEDSKTAIGQSDPFVKELFEIVQKNLADPSFGIDVLASHLHISTAQLTRKTKTLLNMTPHRLIIKMRMENAARLIRESTLNISEIAYKCGYQELSNFSRSFSNYWNESPTQYLKNNRH